LNLIEASIDLEVQEASSAAEAAKENPLFIKLVLQYTRGAKERDYLRGMLTSTFGNNNVEQRS